MGSVEGSLVFSAVGMLASFPDCITSLPAFVTFFPGVFSQQHTDRIHFFLLFGLVLDSNYFVLLQIFEMKPAWPPQLFTQLHWARISGFRI